MSVNVIVGIVCLIVAIVLAIGFLVHLLSELTKWAYSQGRERGQAEAEKAWLDAGREVEQTQNEIWRDETRQ